MIRERLALARAAAEVGGDQGVPWKSSTFHAVARTHRRWPIKRWRRVVGAREDDVRVGVKRGLLPLGKLPRRAASAAPWEA